MPGGKPTNVYATKFFVPWNNQKVPCLGCHQNVHTHEHTCLFLRSPSPSRLSRVAGKWPGDEKVDILQDRTGAIPNADTPHGAHCGSPRRSLSSVYSYILVDMRNIFLYLPLFCFGTTSIVSSFFFLLRLLRGKKPDGSIVRYLRDLYSQPNRTNNNGSIFADCWVHKHGWRGCSTYLFMLVGWDPIFSLLMGRRSTCSRSSQSAAKPSIAHNPYSLSFFLFILVIRDTFRSFRYHRYQHDRLSTTTRLRQL